MEMQDACPLSNVHSHSPKGPGEACVMCTAYIPPFCIFLLILFLTGSYEAYFIFACLGFKTDWKLAYAVASLIIGTLLCVLLLWTFFKVVFTAAGYVAPNPWQHPPMYVGDVADFEQSLPAEGSLNPYPVRQLDRNNKLRYCSACGQFKPDFAHHCDFCERCTYRFDHHCPAMNNCIGRNNYKMFVLFLTYVSVTAVTEAVLMMVSLFVLEEDQWKIVWLVVPIVMLVFGIGVFGFGVTHIVWLCRGDSTMTRHVASFNRDGRRAEGAEERRARRVDHWNAVLGTHRPWWRVILPFSPTRKDTDVVW